MAKETKEDRIVRGIAEQVTEHLHELKSIEANTNAKESDVERWAQSFIKSCLGYASSAAYSIRAQESKGKMRPDLVILKNDKPIFVVEVKKINFDLNKSDFRNGKIQLSEYLQTIGSVRFGMITNGIEWKLYDFSDTKYGGIEIASFDLKADDDTINLSKKSVEDQCYELMDFHENAFSSNYWLDLYKEALAFSPESLAKAILSADIVKNISKIIKGEHEYKANIEILTDRIYWLLEKGLNDVIGGWNDSKSAEFEKFIKTQKRASRKITRKKKENSKTEVTALESKNENENQNQVTEKHDWHEKKVA